MRSGLARDDLARLVHGYRLGDYKNRTSFARIAQELESDNMLMGRQAIAHGHRAPSSSANARSHRSRVQLGSCRRTCGNGSPRYPAAANAARHPDHRPGVLRERRASRRAGRRRRHPGRLRAPQERLDPPVGPVLVLLRQVTPAASPGPGT